MFSRTTPSLHFPIYLLPPLPFRRRKAPKNPQHPPHSAGDGDLELPAAPLSEEQLQGHSSHLRCAKCSVDICLTSQIISKGFTGRHGRAYLVSPAPVPRSKSDVTRGTNGLSLPNTRTDTPSQRQLVTGVHTVSDVRCLFCNSMLGWKYEGAEEESQRYKVGKYILETKMVCSSSDWDHDCADGVPLSPSSGRRQGYSCEDLDDIEFDSQDDDECEDLFAGIWSPSLASRRRQARTFRKAGQDVKSRQ